MVTLKDIFGAVCNHISKTTELTMVDGDMEEPVIRPSFKVFMNTVKTGLFSSSLRQVHVFFDICFYATDKKRSKTEFMDIKDKVSHSFLKPFKIKERYFVYIDDLSFEKIINGVLNCSFNFEIATKFENEEENQYELMEDLYINRDLEE